MTVQQFTNEIKELYSKHLPNSAIVCDYSYVLFPSIHIKPYLIKDKTEAHGNIVNNDLFHITFRVNKPKGKAMTGYTNETEINEDLEIECLAKSYFIKPINDYYVYSSKKLSFRKTTGSPEKILKALDKFFIKLVESLKDDLANDRITSDYVEIVKQKLNVE